MGPETLRQLQADLSELRRALNSAIRSGKDRAAGPVVAQDLESKGVPALNRLDIVLQNLARQAAAQSKAAAAQDALTKGAPWL